MSLGACIPGLVEDGTLSAERGKRILKMYDDLVAGYRRNMGGPAAEAAATEKALQQLTQDAALKKYRAGLAAAAQARMTADIASFKGAGKARAAEAVIVRDDRAPYLSLEYLWKAIRGRAQSRLDQILIKHRADLLGRMRNTEDFDRIVDVMHGSKVDDLNATEVGGAALEVLEELRLRANAAGADIGKLENHGLPHTHDSRRIEAAGFEAWRNRLVPLLDRARTIDRETGEPMADDVLGRVLRDVYDTIVSDGWSTRTPGGMGKPALANRLGEHRFLHFTDGAAWRAYHAEFGIGSTYDALMSHVDRMSRDIALMETLGPNPAAGLKWLQDTAVKGGAIAGSAKERQRAERAGKNLQAYFDTVTGTARDPYDRRVALVASGIRSFEVASKLGSATLSATSDVATQQVTRRFNGLPQTSTLGSYLKHLNPASAEDRAHAIRSGLIAEGYAGRASAQGRMMGEELAGELPRRMAEGVLRLSGLEALTQAGRWAFGMDFISALAMYRKQDFGQLNAPFRRMFERYGIDAAAWDKIRATPLADGPEGSKWLQPLDIADRKLSDRVLGMIQAETDFAVPVGGLEISSKINSAFRSGTILGELGRTAFQFKAFPVTIAAMHGRRMMAMGGWQDRASYLASLLILTTVAGATALQMKEIAKGKDARPMDNWQFWGAAGAQGGGLGIFGDFLKSSQSRFGQDFTDVLAGPAWQTLDTLNSLTFDAAGDAAAGEKVDYGKRVHKLLRSELPGGSLWYARLTWERLVLDQLQQQIDPNYRQSWKRMEKRASETDQSYYWAPGETAPDRTPRIGPTAGSAP